MAGELREPNRKGKIIDLMRTGQWQEHFGIDGPWCFQSDPLSFFNFFCSRTHFSVNLKQGRTLSRGLRTNNGERLFIRNRRHHRPARLDRRRLLGGDGGERCTQKALVIETDVGHRRDVGGDNVGGIPAPSHSHLKHRDLDFL